MALLTFKTAGMKGPFSVQISVGGGFPVDWEIFDYTKIPNTDPVKWKHVQLGSGSGIQWFELPGFGTAADLSQHVIAWNIAATSLDDDAYDVTIQATLRDSVGKTDSVSGDWSVSQDEPGTHFFVGVA